MHFRKIILAQYGGWTAVETWWRYGSALGNCLSNTGENLTGDEDRKNGRGDI